MNKLTKETIKLELRKDESLKTKTYLTKLYTVQELYNYYHNLTNKKCEICQKETRFKNFKLGYDNVCSRSCRKLLKSKEYIPNFNNIIEIEKLKIFLLKEYSGVNTTNKLNKSFFINKDYIKELNTLLYYMKEISETKISIKLIYDFIFGCGICEKCCKYTTFIGFDKGYRNSCNNCSGTLHIKNNVEKEYVLSNFVEKGKFLADKMMQYYNVSYSFVNKWKVKNNIHIENKHKKYSYGEELIFRTYVNNFKIKSNSRNIINPYEIDIVIDDKLCIEYDGLLFHSSGEGFPGDCSRRYKLDLIPEKYELLTIFEDEFLDLNKQKIWFSIINEKLGLNEKINLDDCIIKNIDKEKVKKFVLDNSLDKYVKSEINLGLYLDEELYAVVSFNRIIDKEYLIVNLSTKKNYSIDYSVLVSYFEEEYKPKSIEYYSNRRYLTEINGFNFVENTEPIKFYFKVNENKLFLNYSENEEEMLKNNCRIMYDYGNSKIVKVTQYYE